MNTQKHAKTVSSVYCDISQNVIQKGIFGRKKFRAREYSIWWAK